MARPDKLPKILTEEETDRLLSEPNQRYFGPHRDYLSMRVMLKAGLRASEATALQKEHIGLMSGKLSVREGKGAKDRTSGWRRISWKNSRNGRNDSLAKLKPNGFYSRSGREQRWPPLTFAAR